MGKTLFLGSDDVKTTSKLVLAFEAENYRVIVEKNPESVVKELGNAKPDLVLVAFNTEINNKLCKKIKSIVNNASLVIIGAENESKEDIIKGLSLGVDDYVNRPLDIDIFVAKTRAIMRRAILKHEPDEIIKWENLKINLTSREVFINDGKINLTQKEIMLLYLLISRKGAVLTREVLMELVWEQEYLGDPRTINKHIENLRNKLGRLSDSIETVQGVGYRLKK